MGELYLTLPSNASLDYFPDNTLTKYEVKIERTLNLRGKWMVGLSEIHYSHSWNNINDGELIIEQTRLGALYNVKVKSGRYANGQELVKEIKLTLDAFNMKESIGLYIDNITNYCYINIKELEIKLTMSSELCNVLGFKNGALTKGVHRSQKQTDITEGFTAMYVYCNIVKPQLVGDAMAPLLCVVPVNVKHAGENVVERFHHLQYLPVTGKMAESIKTDIQRDDGRKVPFESGKVIVVLHLKKVSE